MNESKPIPPINPDLAQRLKDIGFSQQEFEPKVGNRFIVKMEGIPSYVIKAVSLPRYYAPSKNWKNVMLTLYNPLLENLEEKLLNLDTDALHTIIVHLLSPVGEVVTTWKIVAKLENIIFDTYDWSSKGESNLIRVDFGVTNVEVTH